MAYAKSLNPFAEDDEEEEPQSRSSGGFDDGGMSEADRRQKYLQQQVMKTANSAVDSTQRSLALIYESEKMGTETAEELMRQGEALKRTEKMVDNMDQDLKTSQRHINSIKSVWGGLVSYFKPKPETTKTPEEPANYQASSKLQNAMSHSKEHEDKYQASHPNLRKLDTGGFGATASVDDKSLSQNGYPANDHLKAAHHKLDNNLDEMCLGLSRLKNLGMGLQSEIEDQDVSLNNLLGKVDKMDLKINKTNEQLKKL
ncbi:hypothetical protein DPEC_G00259180 [Dallia pectoralis]|uniref:Uncharacterized protein n=1 Tax=Dallia pectoralis TaxID=75939 RepID=A0ACC2FRL7_DALPE|nr:hypothetical protein DPEC_G00259180 [Dallia pectoralis]